MKNTLFITLIAVFSLISCSPDDNSNGSDGNYLPLNINNYWTYDVVGESFSGRDSLFVSNDTVINAKTYKKLKTKNQPFGFFSGSLNNNGLRLEGDKILINGTTGLAFAEELPVNITLSDFIAFKSSALPNEELGSVSGVLEQDFQGFPIKIEYTLKSIAQTSLASYTSPNGSVYQDVKPIKIILNLKISSTVDFGGFPVPIAILNTQDVITSTQYFSKNIGMVYAKTQITYQLQDFSQFEIELPIPQSGNQIQQEFLDTYVTD